MEKLSLRFITLPTALCHMRTQRGYNLVWKQIFSRLMASNSSEKKNMTAAPLPPSYRDSAGFSAIHVHPITRQYAVEKAVSQDGGKSSNSNRHPFVTLEEVMAECVINNIMPVKLLSLWVADLTTLRDIVVFPTPEQKLHETQSASAAVLQNGLDYTLCVMQTNLDSIKASAKSFKRSSDKNDIDKAFLPTNLHLQSISIKSVIAKESYSVRHDVTTVGAFTAQLTLDGQAGLEFLWRAYPEQMQPKAQNLDLPNGFIGYPVILQKFKSLLRVASLWPMLRQASSTKEATLTSTSLVNLLENSGLFLGSNGTALVEAMDLLRPSAVEQTFPLSVHVAQRLSSALKLHILDVLETAASDITGLYLRECIVMSQLITATTASILTMFYGSDQALDTRTADQIQQNGLLIYYESLLSCWMDEKVMLQDVIGGLELLREITFVLPRTSAESPLNISSQLYVKTSPKGVMEIWLPPLVSGIIPDGHGLDDQKPAFRFKVFPVFLTVGINEAASLAARQGKIALQKAINKHYGDNLMAYAIKTTGHDPMCAVALTEFAQQMANHAAKNIGLLHAAQSLTRMAKGIRVTMCKSAKDRTAMAVTLEQVTFLQQTVDGLSVAEYDRILTEMRRNGTRRENTVKNIGFARYAFIQEQVEHLPAVYQPPPGTFGKSET